MIVVISSRTPEGIPGRCPVCGVGIQVEPSDPAGDAPCPRCGHLIWFTAEASDDTLVLAITDEIVEAEAVRRLDDALEPGPSRRVVLDLDRVRYLSSAALAALIDLKKRLLRGRVKLILRNTRPDLHEIFRITRLDQVFDVEE